MNRLQEKRLELGLTQPQVSARLKEVEARADVGMVSRYEKGVCLPTKDQLAALEELYGVPRTALYDVEDLDLLEFPRAEAPTEESEQLDKKSILEMSMGAILERVDYEMGKVIDNILDPNTKPTGKRKITVGLELIPSADRKTITVQTTAKSTLVPTDPITTSLYITNQPGTGEMVVAEMVPQVPGQLGMDGGEQDRPKVLKFTNIKQA